MPKPVHLLALLLLPVAARAQTQPATNFTYSAPKFNATQNQIRLEGNTVEPARINSPQLSVVAPLIVGTRSISQVRASGGVSLKLNIAATATQAKIYVEARADSAVLDMTKRTLQLVGNLSGFYQLGAGGKNTLSGERANISFAKNNFSADLENPVLQIPAETLTQSRSDALGELRISADRGQVSQSSASATFSGNAHAKSVGGTNAFDLSAPSFVIARAADGTLSTIQTRGQTSVKYDLPPDPKALSDSKGVGAPTHIEVTSDGATFDRATGKATFSGHVRGSYRLQTASGAQNYAFSGDQAIIGFNPSATSTQSGLSVEVTGPPATINAPGFGF